MDNATQQRIDSILADDSVVLFMKGTREFPQCGFSAATAGILDRLVPDYTTVNVLDDESIRQGIKDYADWPTIPQLYVNKEFVGGADLVQELFASGELHDMLGVSMPAPSEPSITIWDDAAALIRQALASHPEQSLHLIVDAKGAAKLVLGPPDDKSVQVESAGLALYLDPLSAGRANGLEIELEDTPQGQGLRIRRN